MRILALSPYHANSHHRWLTGLQQCFPDCDWTVITLPARAFCWRFVGNAYSLAERYADLLHSEYDLILATSMTNLATLKGLVPKLSSVRTILYFHENQFSYPSRYPEAERDRFHFCMQSLYAAMVSDHLVFNSQYNLDTFLSGARQLLKKMRDFAPKSAISELEKKVKVIPVPLELHWFRSPSTRSGPCRIIWNHRWEYDKAPERFFAVMQTLHAENVPFELYVVGQSFQTKPACFEKVKSILQEKIKHWGYLESASDYRALLPQMDLVVSTALHEYQGLSVLEAAASGCHVLVPNRLAYPEWFHGDALYESSVDDPIIEQEALLASLKSFIVQLEQWRQFPAPDVSALSWTSLRPKYATVMENH